MNILTVDSTTQNLFVALETQDGRFSFHSFKNQNRHSETLCVAISDVLKKSGVDFSAIDVFAVATGPGSFTGIRIGIATVLGMNFASTKKLISISNLELLCFAENKDSAVIDAGNGLYFLEKGGLETLISYDDVRAKNAAKFDPQKDYTAALCEFAKEKAKKGEFVERLFATYIRKSQAEQNLDD